MKFILIKLIRFYFIIKLNIQLFIYGPEKLLVNNCNYWITHTIPKCLIDLKQINYVPDGLTQFDWMIMINQMIDACNSLKRKLSNETLSDSELKNLDLKIKTGIKLMLKYQEEISRFMDVPLPRS